MIAIMTTFKIRKLIQCTVYTNLEIICLHFNFALKSENIAK